MSGVVGIPSGEAAAEITRVGRVTYRVVIVHGTMEYGPDGYGWHVWGRDRAERKARRELGAYRRKQARKAAPWRIS